MTEPAVFHIVGTTVTCGACGQTLGKATENWKPNAVLSEQALSELGSPYTVTETLVLRRFLCPGCGALLDSETALPEDPILEDKLLD
jgi:acetone carboxylase gamma subunit